MQELAILRGDFRYRAGKRIPFKCKKMPLESKRCHSRSTVQATICVPLLLLDMDLPCRFGSARSSVPTVSGPLSGTSPLRSEQEGHQWQDVERIRSQILCIWGESVLWIPQQSVCICSLLKKSKMDQMRIPLELSNIKDPWQWQRQ